MCRAGAASMIAFAREEGIAHEVCGKLVVATREDELPGLARLHERGLANGLEVTRLTGDLARELEPHVSAVAALHVPATGIIDFAAVCAALVRRLERAGATLLLGAEVLGSHPVGVDDGRPDDRRRYPGRPRGRLCRAAR